MGACCSLGHRSRGELESSSNSNISESRHRFFSKKKIQISPSHKRPSSHVSDTTDVNSFTHILFGDEFGYNGEENGMSDEENCRSNSRSLEIKRDASLQKYSWRNSIKSKENLIKTHSISLRKPLKILQRTGIFMKTLSSLMPGTSIKRNLIRLHNKFPQVLPYVSGTVLGFTKISKSLNNPTTWFRPRRFKRNQGLWHAPKHPIPTDTNSPEVSPAMLVENNQEHEGWWRYTMFLLENASDMQEFPIKGMSLIGLENRTGCEIKLSEKRFTHRGKTVRQIFIDGPSQIDVMRCKSSLPTALVKKLIQDREEPFRWEMENANSISRFDLNLNAV